MQLFTQGSAQQLLEALPSLRVPAASAELVEARVLVVGASVGGLATAACLRVSAVHRALPPPHPRGGPRRQGATQVRCHSAGSRSRGGARGRACQL